MLFRDYLANLSKQANGIWGIACRVFLESHLTTSLQPISWKQAERNSVPCNNERGRNESKRPSVKKKKKCSAGLRFCRASRFRRALLRRCLCVIGSRISDRKLEIPLQRKHGKRKKASQTHGRFGRVRDKMAGGTSSTERPADGGPMSPLLWAHPIIK